MKNGHLERIEKKLNAPGILEALSSLSSTDLNTLLLEVFAKRTGKVSGTELLQQYQQNRFVQAATIDCIAFSKIEQLYFEICLESGFQPIELSPLSVLGSCSALGTVSQNKIVSALRNTEILSDATNSLALHVSSIKPKGDRDKEYKFCCVQRHVRAQPFTDQKFSPHFEIGCMVSSGVDKGGYEFECKNLADHFKTLIAVHSQIFGIDQFSFRLLPTPGYPKTEELVQKCYDYLAAENLPSIAIEQTVSTNAYYRGIQFKMSVVYKGETIEIADGGFVDWTQKLLNRKKERFLICGFGLELLFKMSL